MGDFSTLLLSALLLAIIFLPVVLVLLLATFVANLFPGFCKPITEPIRYVVEELSDFVPDPLEMIPSLPKIKKYFGSTKNILFVCFVIIFLLVHYLSTGNASITFTNLSLLFPGAAFEVVISFLMSGGNFDISAFVIKPEDILQTVIFSFITGLFLHLGCTSKDEEAKINFFVKLIYTMLITLFSSIVLGKIPPEVFTVTLPEISLDLDSIGTVTGSSDAMLLLATLQQWGGILLKKLVSLLPVIVAFYFLCQSVSGFAAAFLGGISVLFALSVTNPEALINPDSFGAAFMILFSISAAEFVALFFTEFISNFVNYWVTETEKVFEYYNVVTVLLSYFFYPTLVLPVLAYRSFCENGFNFFSLLISIACLVVFALVIFVGYKIRQWVWDREGKAEFVKFAVAMVINIPIWIIYYFLFIR